MYYTSQEQSWYQLPNLNLSGTKSGGTNLNIPTTGKWTTLARIDNDDIELDFALYRSGIQDDGTLSPFTGASGTSVISMRLLPPKHKTGLDIFSLVSVGTSPTPVGIQQVEFTPSRSIPVGSLLQAKVDGVKLEDTTGTNNRMYVHLAFTSKGSFPKLTDLTDF